MRDHGARAGARTAYCENGASVAVASRNTSVIIASRIESAISFGVRARFAPSTIAIMRSRKPSPRGCVTRTTSQSESTRVPPVTEEKSPPASRSTGADSPVTALSFTEATPSMTSPSAGMISLASTSTRSPRRSALASTIDIRRGRLPSELLRVHVPAHRAQRGRLRLAAAFGHGLGEVREQHRQPQPRGDVPARSRAARIARARRARPRSR